MDIEELMCVLEDNECLVADGLESALVGYAERAGMSLCAAYDLDKCIEALMKTGMTEEQAQEYFYFYFNTLGAYVGDTTPVFLTLLTKEGSDGER